MTQLFMHLCVAAAAALQVENPDRAGDVPGSAFESPQPDSPAQPKPKDPKDKDYDPAQVGFLVGGVIPKQIGYQPLNNQQRWELFVRQNFSLKGGAWFRNFGAAAGDHFGNRPEQWGQGAEGYFRRVGDRTARFTISSGIEHSMAAALGYEVRYLRCKCTGFWSRLGHTLAWNVITVNREGKNVFNLPKVAGAFSGEALSAAWTPGVRWDVRGYQGAFQEVTIGWFFNVLREFGPDIKRAFKK